MISDDELKELEKENPDLLYEIKDKITYSNDGGITERWPDGSLRKDFSGNERWPSGQLMRGGSPYGHDEYWPDGSLKRGFGGKEYHSTVVSVEDAAGNKYHKDGSLAEDIWGNKYPPSGSKKK